MATAIAEPQLVTLDPAKKYFSLHGGVAAWTQCFDKECLVVGGAGTGKTRGILFWLVILAQTYPGIKIIIARKTLADLAKSAMVTLEDDVLGAGHPAIGGLQRVGRTKPYQFQNGSEILPHGFESKEGWKSIQCDLCYINEATEITEPDYEYALSRVRNHKMPYQQMICDCNPDHPAHWLNQRPERQRKDENGKPIFDKDGRPIPQMVRFVSLHRDNPHYFNHEKNEWTHEGREYMQVLNNLTGVRRRRFLLGQWAAAEGAVFEDTWKPEIHCVSDVPRYADNEADIDFHVSGVDWGHTNPGTMLVFGVDRDKRMWKRREIYRAKQLVGWWVRQAKYLVRDFGEMVFVCDPADPAKIAEFRKAGLRVVEAVKGKDSIKTGIQKFEQRLTDASFFVVKGSVGWYNDAGKWVQQRDEALADRGYTCCLEDEMTAYSWPKTTDGKAMKEEPLDIYNDAIDPTRYVIFYVESHYTPSRLNGKPAGIIRNQNLF